MSKLNVFITYADYCMMIQMLNLLFKPFECFQLVYECLSRLILSAVVFKLPMRITHLKFLCQWSVQISLQLDTFVVVEAAGNCCQ